MNPVICQAIQEMKLLAFTYHGENRVVEPHTHGIDNNAHEVLSAWQISGSDPGWRLFHIIDISFLALSQNRFSNARNGYKQDDSRMSQIFCAL